MAAKAKAKAPPEGGPNPPDPPGGQLAAQNELVVQLLQQNQQLMQQLLAQQQHWACLDAPDPAGGRQLEFAHGLPPSPATLSQIHGSAEKKCIAHSM